MVSVIITTYKRDIQLLNIAIESVLNQTYSDIEIILVDDNGRGTSYQIENSIKFLNNKRVKYVVNEINEGAQYSRNIGILNSSGEYVAFLDDDDLWDKNKIKCQLEYFNNPEIGMVFCEGYIFENDNLSDVRTYQPHPVFDKIITLEMLLEKDYIGTTSQALVKKECFAGVGLFDPEMPARQDYEMWIRIATKYSIIGSPKSLFYHRIHAGEQISKNYDKNFNGNYRIFCKYRSEYNKNSYAKSKMLLKLGRVSFQRKRIGSALLYSLRSLICNPKGFVNTIINFRG